MTLKQIKKTLGIALLSMVAVSATAQDLIARQAPIDRRMKDVRNVKINNSFSASAADLANPAANIYTDWRNEWVSKAPGYAPANFKVDLRGFHMPTTNRLVTSKYGPRWGRTHAGLDVKVYIGDTIRAAFDGKVRIVKFEGNGYGNYVVIRHPNGLETVYGHLSKHLCKPDQIVRAGDVIGLGGNTGRSTGSHLHFETRICGVSINPALMFDFEHQDVTGDFFVTTQAYGTPRSNMAAVTTSRRVAAVEEQPVATPAVAAVAAAPAESTPAVAAVSANQNTKNATRSNRTSTKKAKKPVARSYTVQSGDNLTVIARKNGTTVDKLCKANGIKPTQAIRPGQALKL